MEITLGMTGVKDARISTTFKATKYSYSTATVMELSVQLQKTFIFVLLPFCFVFLRLRYGGELYRPNCTDYDSRISAQYTV